MEHPSILYPRGNWKKSSQLEYIKGLFSCLLQGCDGPPAESLSH